MLLAATEKAPWQERLQACSCHSYAAIAALNGPRDSVRAQELLYQERRDALCDGLESIGWERPNAHGSMFVWARLPHGRTDSMQFVLELMEKAGVIVTPGASFGPAGEGFVRMALVQPPRSSARPSLRSLSLGCSAEPALDLVRGLKLYMNQ